MKQLIEGVLMVMPEKKVEDSIKYILNNNITHTFTIIIIPQLNATLFISDNNYSHGTMNFKIIKQ